jgi:hypothetical protein
MSIIEVVPPFYVKGTILMQSWAPISFSRALNGLTLTATLTLIFITPALMMVKEKLYQNGVNIWQELKVASAGRVRFK